MGYIFGDQRMQEVITVTAVNEGRLPVEVRSVIFRLADKTGVIGVPVVAGRRDFPGLLGDGQSLSVQYEKAKLDRVEQPGEAPLAFAVVTDASTNEYLADYPQPLLAD